MDKFLTQKNKRIVLRPEINNSELQSAYFKEIHDQYLATTVKSVPVNFEKSSELTQALSSPTI